jgi:hypothetical protein
MGASYVHGWVGAFYAPDAREGNEILHMKAFTSVEVIRGYTNHGNISVTGTVILQIHRIS